MTYTFLFVILIRTNFFLLKFTFDLQSKDYVRTQMPLLRIVHSNDRRAGRGSRSSPVRQIEKGVFGSQSVKRLFSQRLFFLSGTRECQTQTFKITYKSLMLPHFLQAKITEFKVWQRKRKARDAHKNVIRRTAIVLPGWVFWRHFQVFVFSTKNNLKCVTVSATLFQKTDKPTR